jgi:hypothetical protein
MTSKLSFRMSALQVLTLVVGLLGLSWGIVNLPSSASADAIWDVETHLLRFETYRRSAADSLLTSAAAKEVSACDTHSQRALLLVEFPLAEVALRSGSSREFDQHMQSLEARARQVLSCSPRDSFAWLVAFGLDIEHGILNEPAFDLLAMSYETSRDEAWIGIRRTAVAVPVVLSAPDPIRREILAEFQNLIRHGFVEQPARAYLAAAEPVRLLLQEQIDRLSPRERQIFSQALEKLRS